MKFLSVAVDPENKEVGSLTSWTTKRHCL